MRREKLDEEFTNLKKPSNLPSGYPTILIVVVVQVAGAGKPRHTVPPPALSPEHAPTRPVQRKRGGGKKRTAVTRTRTANPRKQKKTV